MKISDPILIKQAPATVRCPACAKTFGVESYSNDKESNLSSRSRLSKAFQGPAYRRGRQPNSNVSLREDDGAPPR
jgi:hypothetical protein